MTDNRPNSGVTETGTGNTSDDVGTMAAIDESDCCLFTFVVYVVIFGTMVVFGLVGNGLSWVVLAWDRRDRGRVASFLLRTMAVADNLFLMSAGLAQISSALIFYLDNTGYGQTADVTTGNVTIMSGKNFVDHVSSTSVSPASQISNALSDPCTRTGLNRFSKCTRTGLLQLLTCRQRPIHPTRRYRRTIGTSLENGADHYTMPSPLTSWRTSPCACFRWSTSPRCGRSGSRCWLLWVGTWPSVGRTRRLGCARWGESASRWPASRRPSCCTTCRAFSSSESNTTTSRCVTSPFHKVTVHFAVSH